MNLILFERVFQQVRLAAEDPRTKHIRSVLGIKKGGVLFVGFINGERAVAKLRQLNTDGSIELALVETEEAPPLLPIDLVIGIPRPHSARRILFEAACLGVRSMHFFQSERSEPSYAQSRLWQKGEYIKRLRLATEQSFTTHLPKVYLGGTLETILSEFSQRPRNACFVLDNYAAEVSLGALIESQAGTGEKGSFSAEGVVLVLGSERGWTQDERAAFAGADWQFALLGSRVLRTETAVVSAVSILIDRLKLGSQRTQSRLLHLYN